MRLIALALSATALIAQTRPLVVVAQFTHESNSFNPAPTTLADFAIRNNAEINEWRKNKDEVSGYLAGSDQYGFDVYPTTLANATPKGPVTEEALTTIVNKILAGVKAAPRKPAGMLLALHGAMVTRDHPHGDVEIMKRLRAALGNSLPIVVTHDFHANVSPEMAGLTTALITYKEVPHIDQRDRGLQAARILSQIIAGKVKPTQAIVKPPMIYNIVFQYTKVEPLLPIVAESKRLEQNPKILACSVSGGYQYADVPQVGPTVIVVTDNDPALAQREAQRLSDMLYATRSRLKLNLPEPAEAVRRAMASDKQPVILVEMGDNIGGGSSGDATFMLSELVKQKAQGWFVALADPGAATAAQRAGIGGKIDMLVGGKMDKLHGDPVRVRGMVKLISDGKFIEPEIRHGGQTYYDQGLTAVIEVEGGTRDMQNLLMFTTKRQVPFSIHQLVANGVYPQRQKMLVVKAAIAYKAAYVPIAGQIIDVDTGGTTAVNPKRFTFRLARRPLFGLD